jgi:hypothetical protein
MITLPESLEGFMRKRLARGLAFGLAALISGGVAADDVGVNAQLSQTQVALGHAVQLDVIVTGEQDVPAPDIQLPDISVRYIGPSSLFSIENGRISRSITHRFLLLPQKTGTLGIGPIVVSVQGKTLHTPELTLEVVPDAGPAAPSDSEPSPDTLQLQIGIDKRRLRLNESVPVRVQLLVRGVVVSKIGKLHLQAEGFRVKPFGRPRQSDVVINGNPTVLLEFETLIEPVRPGALSVGPARITCEMAEQAEERERPSAGSIFDGFFNRARGRVVTVTADPVAVEVVPLPKADQAWDL